MCVFNWVHIPYKVSTTWPLFAPHSSIIRCNLQLESALLAAMALTYVLGLYLFTCSHPAAPRLLPGPILHETIIVFQQCSAPNVRLLYKLWAACTLGYACMPWRTHPVSRFQ